MNFESFTADGTINGVFILFDIYLCYSQEERVMFKSELLKAADDDG